MVLLLGPGTVIEGNVLEANREEIEEWLERKQQ
jgi:hypothetical protein